MRKAGIIAIAVITALVMVVPSLSVVSDGADSWDSMSSAYSLSGTDADSVYELLTNDYGNHFALVVFNDTGFNFLANENNSAMGTVREVKNISFSDGIIKKIDNKYETVTERYREIVCDMSITISIYDGTLMGSLTNNLYTTDDRGFSELLSYLGLADTKSFTTGDEYKLTLSHAESYTLETTTEYYRETLAGDYYLTKIFTESVEVLTLSGSTLYYKSASSGQTKSADCSISMVSRTDVITNYDYGTVEYPTEGTGYTARVSSSSNIDGSASYVFGGSTHVAEMTDPQTSVSYEGTCDAKSYSEITEYIAKSGPNDLYPETLHPEDQIKSLSKKTIHTTVPEVEDDIDNLNHKYGLVKNEKDLSYLKQVAYAAAIIVFILAVALIYLMLARKRNA